MIRINLTQVPWLLILLLSISSETNAQNTKPGIDFSAIENWPNIHSATINNNGTYVGYMTSQRNSSRNLLYLSSISGKWKCSFNDIARFSFLKDNNSVVLLGRNDSLIIVKLGNEKRILSVGNVESFNLFNYNGIDWLLYTDIEHRLTLFNTKNNESIQFSNVNSYQQNKLLNTLMIISQPNERKLLSWLNLDNLRQKVISEGLFYDNLIMDQTGRKLAFSSDRHIYYCSLDKASPYPVIIDIQKDLDRGLIINRLERFSNDGRGVFVQLRDTSIVKPPENSVMVDVWSSSDARLQSQQLHDLHPHNYLAILDLASMHTNRLQQEYETVRFLNGMNDSLITTRIMKGYDGEENWNESGRYRNYLLNCNSREKIDVNFIPISLSPNSKFILGIDSSRVNLVLYNTLKGAFEPITLNLLPNEKALDYFINDKRRFRFGGWIKKTSFFLIYDDYDIWKIDTNDLSNITCITNGYGRKNHIAFRISSMPNEDSILSEEQICLLTAFNTRTKENGFYKVSRDLGTNPVLISMANFYYNYPESSTVPPHFPIKARDANVWIVQREESCSAPNYYITTDFRMFKSISDFHPEKKYNWQTSQLVNYRSLNGEDLQGILYKPEDFDSTKRYPIIYFYYQKLSDKLNTFEAPDYSSNNINIPYFVSNGYLVFTPDINFEVGKPGESAYNSVIGAANHLIKLNYVDSLRMGLYGHSFAGGLTNYIITRTNRFSAAISSAGHTNLISAAGSITLRDGTPADRGWLEIQQGRIGYSIWERPDYYIENSPVFKADKINTPLLMANNILDEATNFSQGVELFTALRRLKKKVWMLQYDGETHGLIKIENMRDYTLRIQQYYDHYLKDAAAPLWMLDGIAAKDKGRKTGLELDTLGRTPGLGLVTPEEQKKIDEYSKIPLEQKLRSMTEK